MACISKKKEMLRSRRQRAVRSRVRGTAERPRLSIFRSGRHMYVQLIDDNKGVTLCAISTLHSSVKSQCAGKRRVEQAKILGIEAANLCKSHSIEKVCFDRNGFIYHGRVAAVAAGAREAGLDF